MEKPLVAVTMGDPAGVGPEVVAGAWNDARLHEACRPFVVGNAEVMRRAARLRGARAAVELIQSPQQATPSPALLPCLEAGNAEAAQALPGQIDARGGQAAYDALVAAARLALAGRVDAITTGPLNKAALWKAGHRYPGHTELLAELCGVSDFAMMLYLAPGKDAASPAGLGVVHVTLHMSLREALGRLSEEEVLRTIRLAGRALGPLAGKKPRIGVCALNPHAGESGLFGDEEQRVIGPAVQKAAAEGIDAHGPYPTDTLMVRARDGEFDAVVAMYHDQGHIALKLLGMHKAVNVTLGLPIIRTSVAHGTAFEVAWQGRADCRSLVEAARVASVLARKGSGFGVQGSAFGIQGSEGKGQSG